MSKGSPIVPIRIDSALLHCLDAEIVKVNRRRTDQPYTRSSFIQAAIRDKLKHIFRSRKDGKKRPPRLTQHQIECLSPEQVKKLFDEHNAAYL